MPRPALRLLFAVCLAILLGPGLLRAESGGGIPALYRAEIIVTGKEMPDEHRRGLRETIREVAVRLTGDPGLEGDDRLAPLLALAPVFVASYEYEDRMKNLPVNDEQGTRERPHFLRVAFQPKLIDTALAALGLSLWPEPRPTLAVRVTVADGSRRYVVTAAPPAEDARRGEGQRQVMLALSRRRGVPVLLPAADGTLPPGSAAALDATLSMAEDGYWTIDWTFAMGATRSTGRAGPLSFDGALRAAFDQSVIALRSATR